MNAQRITIATGIYPPDIGGPARYAEMLVRGFSAQGHTVRAVTFGRLLRLPTGLRHIVYFFKLIPSVLRSRYVCVMDTFSSALPAVVVATLLRKKIAVRVGGDFLWEQYVERTREPVLLSEFYTHERTYSLKERIVYKITRFVFWCADAVVFTTAWQRDMMVSAYEIPRQKTHIVENVFEKKELRNIIPRQVVLLSPSRDIFLKNKVVLEDAVRVLKNRFPDISLDTTTSTPAVLQERIRHAYCVVVPSLSEVSPNIVLEALSLGVPVVVTEDCGMKERLGDAVVWVDPRDVSSIASGIESLFDHQKYSEYMSRISSYTFQHTEKESVDEYIHILIHI